MTPPHIPEKTRSLALARQLSTDVLSRLDLARYPAHSVEKGRLLIDSRQRLDALPYVESGRLDAVLDVRDDGVEVIPVTFCRGEIALLSALFSEGPLHGRIVAAEPLKLRWLPIEAVESVLLGDKELLLMLVRFLAQRLREVRARERAWLERGVQGRVRAGLARVALESAPAPGEPWLISATHEHLASRCGVSRPKLSQELKQLENAGILRLNRGRIELLDYSALTADA